MELEIDVLAKMVPAALYVKVQGATDIPWFVSQKPSSSLHPVAQQMHEFRARPSPSGDRQWPHICMALVAFSRRKVDAMETIYTVLPFQQSPTGVVPGISETCASAEMAVAQANALRETCVGAVAFARTFDLASGVCGPVTMIERVGEVPALSYLA